MQNVSPTSPITVWVTLNDNSGGTIYFNNAIVIAPRSEWVASTSELARRARRLQRHGGGTLALASPRLERRLPAAGDGKGH